MTRKENNIILFSIILCWASSYIFIKDLPADLSSYGYLTMTAGIASVLLVVIFHNNLRQLDRAAIIRGFLLAILMSGNLLAEKAGLAYMPSSSASFLSAMDILFVPLLMLLIKIFPTKNNVVGIAVILLGLLITNGFHMEGFFNEGTGFMLLGGLFMALYTIAAADFSKKSNPLLIGITQIIFTAVIGFVLWFLEEPRTFATVTYSRQMLSSVFMLAFFSKAYAYIMLLYSEKYASAINVTIIASTEPVVTLVLALLIPNSYGQTEIFRPQALMGAICITVGAVIAGTDFLNDKKRRSVQEKGASI